MMESRTWLAVPPGETLKEQMQYRNIDCTSLAEKLRLSTGEMEALLEGKSVLSADIARALEAELGVSAGFWLKLEEIYRETLERVRQENSI